MNRASSPISGCPPVDTVGGGVVGSGVRIVGGVGLAVVGTGLGLVVGGGVVGSGVRCGMTGGGVGSVVGIDVEGKGVGDDYQYSLISMKQLDFHRTQYIYMNIIFLIK